MQQPLSKNQVSKKFPKVETYNRNKTVIGKVKRKKNTK